MQEAVTRKLIDIKAPVFRVLSNKALREGVSLKRYIENLLESDASAETPDAPEGVTDPRVLSLIGMAKPTVPVESIEDDKLRYILSK
jgi:hypothetical protein